MDDSYYLAMGSEQKGLYTLSQLRAMWRSGSITADMLYCQEGFEEWLSILLLAKSLDPQSKPSDSPTTAERNQEEAEPLSNKRQLPTFLLCFFLGWSGAHAFYVGRIKDGIIYVSFILLMFLPFGWRLLWGLLSLVDLPSGLLPLGVLFWELLVLVFIAIFLLGDFIRILAGVYKDGNGRKITKWT
jgi:hypothetical protein